MKSAAHPNLSPPPKPNSSFNFWVDSEQTSRWFRRLWIAAMALTALSLGKNLGIGNINPFERSLFLAAGIFFIFGRPIDKTALSGLILMVLAILGAALASKFSFFEWSRTLMALIAFITIAAYLVVEPRESDALLILKSVAWLPVVLVVLGLIFFLLLGRPMMARDHTGAMRLGGAVIPAFLAASCYAASIAAGFLYVRERRTLYVTLVIAAIAISALSGSRMASVCAVASGGLCLALSRHSTIVKVLAVAYGVALLGVFLLTLGDQLLVRFMSGSNSGRELLWASLRAAGDQYPLAGIGWGHHGMVIPESVSRWTGTVAAHNEWLRLRVELGWIGCAFFAIGWTTYWMSRASRFVLPTLVHIALVLVFCIVSTTDNTLTAIYFLLGLLSIGLGTSLVTGSYITRGTRP